MIGEGAFRIAVRRELKDWERMMPNDFTRGVVKGLKLAERIALRIHREELARRPARLATFNRQTAAEFWRTICTAANAFLRGDHTAAKRRLLKTVQQYERAREVTPGVFS